MQKTSIKGVVVCLFIAGALLPAWAAIITSAKTGNWDDGGTWTGGGVPGASDTVIIRSTHTITDSAPTSACYRLETDLGGELKLSSTYGRVALTVSDAFVNNGTFHAFPLYGRSALTVGGNFTNTGTYRAQGFTGCNLTVGGKFLNTVTATFSHALDSLDFNGDFANEQTGAIFGRGTVTFGGSAHNTLSSPEALTFLGLIVNKPGGSLTLACDLAVQVRGLTVSAGTFAVGGHTLTLGTTFMIAGRVTVNAGGTFSAVGSQRDGRAFVTAADAAYPYSFTTESGATIAARWATFLWMNSSGIVVSDGASISPTDNFSDCSFDHGNTDGPMLKIENSQVIDDMVDVNFDGSTGYNIEKLANAGHIKVAGGTGTRWGEDYDNDPNNRIEWVSVAIGEQTGLLTERQPCGATVVRGVLNMGQRLTADGSRLGIGLYDANGREVMALRPGANDVRHLTPGVYFVKSATGNRPRRVVIAR